jgi:hypothetical protein
VLLDGVVQACRISLRPVPEAASGTHKLELRLPGFEPYSREIYVSNSLLRIETTLIHAGSGVGYREAPATTETR